MKAGAPSDLLELPALLELVDDRDRVDGLALGVQGQRRAVDPAVALSVEVRLVEDLADGRDGARGEQHASEDGLLGVHGLRWNRTCLDYLGHVGSGE